MPRGGKAQGSKASSPSGGDGKVRDGPALRTRWVDAEQRREIIDALSARGIEDHQGRVHAGSLLIFALKSAIRASRDIGSFAPAIENA